MAEIIEITNKKMAETTRVQLAPNIIQMILRRPYSFVITYDCCSDEWKWIGQVLEFPGTIAVGKDPGQVHAELMEVTKSWLAAALEAGQDIPEPLGHNLRRVRQLCHIS